MASKSTVTFIFLISNLLSLIANCNAYDYFWLVQHWPPSVCSGSVTGSCQQNLKYFAIYGFWPENNDGTFPSYCFNSPFDPNQIESIRGKLDAYWPIVYEGENERAWKYAWEAHGTCSENKFNQTEYFETALKLRTTLKYDVFSILRFAGIKPGGVAPFFKNDVEIVLYQKLGKVFVVTKTRKQGKLSFLGLCCVLNMMGLLLEIVHTPLTRNVRPSCIGQQLLSLPDLVSFHITNIFASTISLSVFVF